MIDLPPGGSGVRCIVYRGRKGLLLVPDCMRASVEAERDYGPLQRCGEIETDRLDPMLVHAIDEALDRDAFVQSDVSLALRQAYQAADVLPLPDGFEWHMSDFWDDGVTAKAVHGPSGVMVAEVRADAASWSWHVVTNTHRPWLFRGTYVATTQAAAMQYLAMWVVEHDAELQRSAMQVSAASAPATTAPR